MPLKFSIITVCKNAANDIGRTFRSVQEQTYPHVEHIVIDGVSTDGTLEIIEANREKIAYFVSEPDTGIYQAMNKGIRAATGDILCFLNAGDHFVGATAIQIVHDLIEQKPGCGFYYGDLVRLDSKNDNYEVRVRLIRDYYDLYHGWFPHPSTFFRKAAFEKVGEYDERYKMAGDHAWYLKAVLKYGLSFCKIYFAPTIFVTGGLSTNGQNIALAKQERKHIEDKHFGIVEQVFYNNQLVRKIFQKRVFRKIFSTLTRKKIADG